MNSLYKFFVDKKGFDIDTLRTLVVKYPYIIGKTEENLNDFFKLMASHGLSETETMKVLLECPKLVSKNLNK